MSPFIGTWEDQAGSRIEVEGPEKESSVNNFKITYPSSRSNEPFYGYPVEHNQPVIYVNFRDSFEETGVLSEDETTIYWRNGSSWKKQ